MDMDSRLPLAQITEEVAGNLSQAERAAFTDVVNAAAEGKNLSRVHWHLLKSELRALPKLMPKDIQTLINKLIEGLNRVAATEWWAEVFTTFDKIEIIFNKEWVSIAPHVQSAIYALKNIKDAIETEDEDLEDSDTVCTAAVAVTNIVDAAYHAAYDASYDVKTRKAAQADEDFDKFAIQEATRKATIAHAEAKQRQRDTLLALINNAPIPQSIQRAKAAVKATRIAYEAAEAAYAAEENASFAAFSAFEKGAGCGSEVTCRYESAEVFNEEAKAAKAAYEAAERYLRLVLKRDV